MAYALHGELCRHQCLERRRNKEVDFLAHHDVLTKLPNRYSRRKPAPSRLLLSAYRAGEKRGCHAFIDLDRFKIINDTPRPSRWRPVAGGCGRTPFGERAKSDIVASWVAMSSWWC